MGGVSVEHDVSIMSGTEVREHLDKKTYHVSSVTITQKGEWAFSNGEGLEYLDPVEAIPKLKSIHPDCIFIALHGPGGEDGRIQGMFDTLGIPYVGSGCEASAISMDKLRAKILAADAGAPLADRVGAAPRGGDAARAAVGARVTEQLAYPCVVKRPYQGSSLATLIAKDADDFRDAVEAVLPYGIEFMVERFIEGIELAVSVLDVDEEHGPVALPVTEIRPKKDGFLNYHAKYTAGATEEITPADIPDAIRDRVQDYAIRAHQAMGCRGLSRSDFMVKGDDVYWLEINTIPGLTPTSLFPQAAEAAGISFKELVGRLVESALI